MNYVDIDTGVVCNLLCFLFDHWIKINKTLKLKLEKLETSDAQKIRKNITSFGLVLAFKLF